MKVIDGIDGLRALVGGEALVSDWMMVDAARIAAFADATGDHQWIHIDVEKAKTGPFGGPIAHGYLTLSLGPTLSPQVSATGTV